MSCSSACILCQATETGMPGLARTPLRPCLWIPPRITFHGFARKVSTGQQLLLPRIGHLYRGHTQHSSTWEPWGEVFRHFCSPPRPLPAPVTVSAESRLCDFWRAPSGTTAVQPGRPCQATKKRFSGGPSSLPSRQPAPRGPENA